MSRTCTRRAARGRAPRRSGPRPSRVAHRLARRSRAHRWRTGTCRPWRIMPATSRRFVPSASIRLANERRRSNGRRSGSPTASRWPPIPLAPVGKSWSRQMPPSSRETIRPSGMSARRSASDRGSGTVRSALGLRGPDLAEAAGRSDRLAGSCAPVKMAVIPVPATNKTNGFRPLDERPYASPSYRCSTHSVWPSR